MISVIQLGTVDYALSLRLQQQLVALRKEEKISDLLLLLEHKPVITLGRNAKARNVIASAELLAQRGVELFECDRGGDVTFHGPGQIVGYPIFDLRGFSTNLSSRASRSKSDGESRDLGLPRKHLGAVDFVRCLEDVLMRTCADFGIPTKRIPGLTGVWNLPSSLSSRAEGDDSKNRPLQSRDLGFAGSTPKDGTELASPQASAKIGSLDYARVDRHKTEAKLAAIGIHISRFVTSHGFALNVAPDLSYFDLIIPCGIKSKAVTSMQRELGRELDLNAVCESISRNFGVVFQSQMLWVDTIDVLLGRTVGVPMRPPRELRQIQKDDTYRA
jgi:lipoyl(octanoyl) transferase